MFGYVTVYKPELKIKEWETFRAYYCGLCHAIGESCSSLSRLLLNYDCTFLYTLYGALFEKPAEFRQSRCPARPLRRKTYAIDEGREYAAAVNVMLAVEKLKDDKKDGFSPISAAGAAVLSRAGKRASERFPAAARAISTAMAEISEMERSDKPGDADRAADPFARMLAEIFRGIAYEPKEPLAVAGYNLGRWIYLIDAYDDAEKDAKSGNYNPYVVKYGKKAMERKADTVGKEAEFGLVASLEAASGAYGLLEIKKNKGITDNIMFGGLYKKTEYVLGKGK